MATEVKAFEANGRLYKSLDEARRAELLRDLQSIFSVYSNDISFVAIINKREKVYKLLEEYMLADKLLGVVSK